MRNKRNRVTKRGYMEVAGENYKVLGKVNKVPLLDIPMLSDEKWENMTDENAVNNFIKHNGYQPESIEAAHEWQRKFIESIEKGE